LWFVIAVLILIGAGLAIAWRLRSTGELPEAGRVAPEFSLPSQDGSPIRLSDYRGKWVVLYFYPKDMTSGCTTEARNFQRDQPQYAKRNAVVIGVSVDSVDSHRQFCAKEGLQFKLAADTAHKVAKEYGSLINFGVVQIAARHTFLIDPQGKIKRVYSSVNPSQHSRELLAALDEVQGSSADAMRP
jgi:peroxiredoxin Q/BCP